MTTTTRLTIAVLADSEPVTLQSTLQSAQAIADEILVSSPAKSSTLAPLAERYQARLVDGGEDNRSVNCNALLQQATGDWVLWLEAGERMELAEAEQVRKFIDGQPSSGAARLLLHRGGSNGQMDDEVRYQLRLHRRRPHLLFSGRVCATLEQSLQASQISPQDLSVRIACLTNDPVLLGERLRQTIRLARLERSERALDASALVALGEALFLTGKSSASRDVFQQAIEVSQRGAVTMLEAYYGLLTALEASGAGREAQMDICLRALEVFPHDAQLLCAMGGYLQAHGRLDLAGRSYETAWRHGQFDKTLWHLEQLPAFAGLCYALSLELQRREDEAVTVLEQSLESHESARLRRQLLQLHVKHGRLEPALAQLAAMPSSTPGVALLDGAVRGACLAGQKNWIAARAYLLEAFEAGCRDPICLRWLTSTLLATGESGRATDVLGQWQIHHPNHPEIQGFHRALQAPAGTGRDHVRSGRESA